MNYIEVEFELDPLLPAREVLVYELGELMFESFVDTPKGLKGYIPQDDFNESSLSSLMSLNLPKQHFTYKVNVIPQRNWNAEWEKDFDPIWIGDHCLIRAPFHDEPKPGTIDLLISPKMSFGTGHHQTTYLMTAKLLQTDVRNKSVLDMGCGTAVLGILARKMGASEVLAIDIEEFAYENARENVKLNQVDKVIVYKGGADLLKTQSFHLILANINKNVLLADLKAYNTVLEPGGRVYLSGFYTTDFEDINVCATELGLVFEEMNEKEGWAMLSFRKPGS